MNYTAHEYANIFPMMTAEEHAGLVGSMRLSGFDSRYPVVIYQDKILDGRNRYAAAQECNLSPVFDYFEGDDNAALQFVISSNLNRRHLDTSERGMVAARVANIKNGDNQHTLVGRSIDLPSDPPDIISQQQAADRLNVSVPTVKRAKEVLDQGDSSLIAAVSSGNVSLNAATGILSLPKEQQAEVVAKGEKEILAKAKEIRTQQITERKAEQHRKVEEISKGNKAITGSKKYRVIYADPPWQYGDTRTGLDGYSAAADHYPTMSIAQMCDLPIKDLALDDAVLFMWVTSPLLEECFPLINAWGFKYKTSFVWDKVKHNVGHYNSVRHEFLLICTRGSCKPDIPKLIDSVQTIERTEKHSEKPEEFRAIIDTLYTAGDCCYPSQA